MAAVDVAALREHIETDLSDDALGRLLADAAADVVARFGDDSARVDVRDGGTRFVRLSRPASAVSSVTEQSISRAASSVVTLSANDYVLRHGGRTLERITSGDNYRECWYDIVTVTYTPKAEEVIRNRVVIDLVQLAITYKGLIRNETIGDYDSEGQLDAKAYHNERENILAGISNHRGLRIV